MDGPSKRCSKTYAEESFGPWLVNEYVILEIMSRKSTLEVCMGNSTVMYWLLNEPHKDGAITLHVLEQLPNPARVKQSYTSSHYL